MEPQLKVLAGAIRAAGEAEKLAQASYRNWKQKEVQDLMADYTAKLTAEARCATLKEAWLIMTGKNWPED